MHQPFFRDQNQSPTPTTIHEAIGAAAPAWDELFARIRAEQPDLSESWNYYADGKSWLLKVTRKSKTVFWLSIERDSFRVGFYFPERLVDALFESALSDSLKAQIKSNKPTGKLRGVSVEFGSKKAVPDVLTLIALKLTLK